MSNIKRSLTIARMIDCKTGFILAVKAFENEEDATAWMVSHTRKDVIGAAQPGEYVPAGARPTDIPCQECLFLDGSHACSCSSYGLTVDC
jgi:hypothetical protein